MVQQRFTEKTDDPINLEIPRNFENLEIQRKLKKRIRSIFMMWISESMIQLRYSIRINETMLNTLLAQNYFK